MNLKRGDQKNLAEKLGISGQHFNDILHGRRHPSREMAIKLEELTGIERCAWLYPDKHHNPLIKKATGRTAPRPCRSDNLAQTCSTSNTSSSSSKKSRKNSKVRSADKKPTSES
jgi:transcriptional regulator with XRE-family HTH domain